jgi:hypothetical protein
MRRNPFQVFLLLGFLLLIAGCGIRNVSSTPSTGSNTAGSTPSTGNSTSSISGSATPGAGGNPYGIVTTQAHANAEAQATSTARVQATAPVIGQNPNPYGGRLVASDAMSGPGSAFGWGTGNDTLGNQCNFKDNAYHVVGICDSNGIMYGNTSKSLKKFAFEIHLNAGKNCGHLHFYFDSQPTSIDVSVCQDGQYDISGSSEVNGTAAATHTGTNQYNIIGIVADATHLTLYINYARVDSLSGVYTGIFGLKLEGFGTNGIAEVVYTDARLWSL